MRKIEPALPDLFPLAFQLGPAPPASGTSPMFDPVELRIPIAAAASHRVGRGDRSIRRRPTRLLVHTDTLRREPALVDELVVGGHGLLVVADGSGVPDRLPGSRLERQVVAVVPCVPSLWGEAAAEACASWAERGVRVGVMLGLAPCLEPFDFVRNTVRRAAGAGAAFAVAAPLVVAAEERHRVFDRLAGEVGDVALENALFHTDMARLSVELEREASRACREHGLGEWLPGPGTAVVPAVTFAAGAGLLVWARRLDLLDGVSSLGWQLRRGASALLAAGRGLDELLAEDNVRIVPGFNPWVEAFARSLWAGCGPPFEDLQSRWLAGAWLEAAAGGAAAEPARPGA